MSDHQDNSASFPDSGITPFGLLIKRQVTPISNAVLRAFSYLRKPRFQLGICCEAIGYIYWWPKLHEITFGWFSRDGIHSWSRATGLDFRKHEGVVP